MTQPSQPTERFAQHPRLAELVTALGFRRFPLFLVADDAGEVVEHAGRVPTLWLRGRVRHGAAAP